MTMRPSVRMASTIPVNRRLPFSCLYICALPEGIPSSFMLTCTFDPVSYTHLDVYKRQSYTAATYLRKAGTDIS